MENLRVSLIQTDLHWEQPDANRATIEEMIWDIQSPTDLIILPETFTTGYSMKPAELAEVKETHTFRWMKQIAKQANAAIMGSYIVKDGGNCYNRCYIIHPDGESDYYDKKHLFSLAGETEGFTPGHERKLFEVKGWRIRPMICYDLRFPVWARSLATPENLYEYDLLIYVANWPAPRINAWDTLLKARAIENLSFSIGVNRIGKDENDLDYPGHSAVYDCKGIEVALAGEQTAIVQAELDASLLQKFRSRFPFQQDADQFSIG